MGMIIYVYKNPHRHDTTRGGITHRYTDLCVVNCRGTFEPKKHRPAVMLVDDRPMGKPYPKLVPAYEREKGTGDWLRSKEDLMFGGNYAGCSDSRFRDFCAENNGGPYGMLPVFDRIEHEPAGSNRRLIRWP